MVGGEAAAAESGSAPPTPPPTPPESAYLSSWRDSFSSWGEPRWWNASECESLIAREFGWFNDVYRGYRYHIQRVDACRYFVLYKHGGVYADLVRTSFWYCKTFVSGMTH